MNSRHFVYHIVVTKKYDENERKCIEVHKTFKYFLNKLNKASLRNYLKSFPIPLLRLLPLLSSLHDRVTCQLSSRYHRQAREKWWLKKKHNKKNFLWDVEWVESLQRNFTHSGSILEFFSRLIFFFFFSLLSDHHRVEDGGERGILKNVCVFLTHSLALLSSAINIFRTKFSDGRTRRNPIKNEKKS